MQINNKKQHAIYVGERIMAELVVPPVVFDTPTVNTDYVPPLKSPQTLNPSNDPALVSQVDTQAQFTSASGGFTSITNENGVPEFTVTAQRPIEEAPFALNYNYDGGLPSDSPNFEIPPEIPNNGLEGDIKKAQSEGDLQNKYFAKGDWRVRISLAQNAQYLYNDPSFAGILKPLSETGGVIFPYTPSVQINYTASYDPTTITHSNYKIFQYQGSGIENVTITGTFTAQDAREANYLLAVIHFFRTVTKMFYGQDQYPKAGTPPPLCFLHGLGTYQFDNHPMVISSFAYQLPDDVDYIRAGTIVPVQPGESTASQQPQSNNNDNLNALEKIGRLIQNLSQFKIGLGGEPQPPDFIQPGSYQVQEPTYVPTRIQIAITALPVVSRNDISNNFSLQQYGSGKLLRGSRKPGLGGIW